MALALAALAAPLGSGALGAVAAVAVPVVFGAFFFFRFTFSGLSPSASFWTGFGFSASLALDFGVPALTGAGADDFAAEGFA